MNYLPADFYDDPSKGNRSSKSKQRNRVKSIQNTNKIKWDDQEKFDWVLSYDELFALDEIMRIHHNTPGQKDLLNEKISKAYKNRNPYEVILKFCYNRKETYDSKSLTRVFLDVLRYVEDPVISDELKVHAFNLFSQYNRGGIAAGIKAFQLIESKDKFIKKIQKIAEYPWVTQAAMVALELKLCDDLPINMILFPLFMNNRQDFMFEYMDASEKARMEMIKTLDSLMISDYAFDDYCNKHDIPGPSKNRKVLKNLILKIRLHYGMDEDATPITTNYHYTKYLRYIMYEYYDCERMAGEIYEDKVIEIADKGVELQKSLVEFTVERGYNADAAKWNNHYNLNIDLSAYSQFNLSFQRTSLDTDDYYKFSLHSSRIFFVDNQKAFFDMLQDLTIYNVAGLDCEQQLNNDLSIIQIAIRNKVFIIDAMNMREEFEWKKLLTSFFNSYKIAKLGCGINGDLKTIESFLGIEINRDARYIDLGKIAERIFHPVKGVGGFEFPFHVEYESQPGLSKLTKLCFGKSLNKSCAISNWSVRPLREEQLTYAALDAFIAIEIYEKINDLLLDKEMTISTIYERMMEEQEEIKIALAKKK